MSSVGELIISLGSLFHEMESLAENAAFHQSKRKLRWRNLKSCPRRSRSAGASKIPPVASQGDCGICCRPLKSYFVKRDPDKKIQPIPRHGCETWLLCVEDGKRPDIFDCPRSGSLRHSPSTNAVVSIRSEHCSKLILHRTTNFSRLLFEMSSVRWMLTQLGI